jgi:hypothetical protein
MAKTYAAQRACRVGGQSYLKDAQIDTNGLDEGSIAMLLKRGIIRVHGQTEANPFDSMSAMVQFQVEGDEEMHEYHTSTLISAIAELLMPESRALESMATCDNEQLAGLLARIDHRPAVRDALTAKIGGVDGKQSAEPQQAQQPEKEPKEPTPKRQK